MLGLQEIRAYTTTPYKQSSVIHEVEPTPWTKLEPEYGRYYYEDDGLGLKSNLETKFPTQ